VALEAHVDKINHNNSADLAKPELLGDLDCRFHVGPVDGFIQSRTAAEFPAVDINGRERLHFLNHQRSAGLQSNAVAEDLLESVQDTGFAPDILGIHLLNQAVHLGSWRNHPQKLAYPIPMLFRPDHDGADLFLVMIPQGTLHDAQLLMKQSDPLGPLVFPFDPLPQTMNIIRIRFQIALASPGSSSANDIPAFLLEHLLGDLMQAFPFFFLADLTGNVNAAPIRHKNYMSARKGDLGGQRRAFFAEGLFFHLNHQLVPFAQQALDGMASATADAPVHNTINQVVDGKESVLEDSDIQKGCLQMRDNRIDNPFVNVPGRAAAGRLVLLNQQVRNLILPRNRNNLMALHSVHGNQ